MANFTPYSSLAGGVLIGLAAVLLLFFNGRIAGISGILKGAVDFSTSENRRWRIVFLLGLIVGAFLVQQIKPINFQPRPDFPLWLLAAGGMLIGFGTRMGNGCTSGHGVCGIARLSLRSIAATITFMSTGFLTVYLLRHVLA